MRVIPFAALAPVPWANGGGVTREIAAGRDADAILWRVSLAEVETEGPFSFLPGLHRILTVVGGAGMELVTPEGRMEALPLRPVRFSGALPVTGRLPRGPVRNLNLMLREGRCRGEVAGLGDLPDGGAGLRLLHVAAGGLQVGEAMAGAGTTVIDPAGAIRADAGARILDIRILPETA